MYRKTYETTIFGIFHLLIFDLIRTLVVARVTKKLPMGFIV